MRGMRRLLASVAFVAVMLAAPVAGAQAAAAPTFTSAQAGQPTKDLPVFGWNDVRLLPIDPMTYRVFRASRETARSPMPARR